MKVSVGVITKVYKEKNFKLITWQIECFIENARENWNLILSSIFEQSKACITLDKRGLHVEVPFNV